MHAEWAALEMGLCCELCTYILLSKQMSGLFRNMEFLTIKVQNNLHCVPEKSLYSKKNFALEFLQGKVTIICVDFIKKTV